MRHIVALSGGKDSVAMALALKEREPNNDYEYVYTPTENELPIMKDHFARLEVLLGKSINNLAPVTLVQIMEAKRKIPNYWMRFCTPDIKIRPFEKFIRSVGECTVYVGIRADESGDREGVDYDRIAGVTRRFPMDEWGWTLQDVLSYLDCHNVEIPYRTDCAWCFFQTLYEWYLLWHDWPDIWAEGEEWERRLGHTFRTPGKDSWPTALEDMRKEFERGRIPTDRRKKRTAMCSVCAR